MKVNMIISYTLFVKVGDKMMYTRKLHKWKNGRMVMRLRALKQMGVTYYYDA
jgi:hypothetical protein